MSSAPGCPLCGAGLLTGPALECIGVDGRRWDYLRCPGCSSLCLTPRPALEQLAACYADPYYGRGQSKFPVGLDWVRRQAYVARARSVRSVLGKAEGRVLDVGCGSGEFLQEMGRLGHEIFGTELPGPAARRAARVPQIRLLEGELREGAYEEAFFDVITLWHVLEHVPEPAQLLSHLTRLLKPRGLVFLEVPNAGSWQARLFEGRWLHMDPPRHLYQFTARALRSLLEGAGLELVRQGTFSLQLGGVGWLQSMLNRVMTPPNLLYELLLSRGHYPISLGRKTASVVLAVLAAPVAGMLALLEGAAGSGAVLRCVCRKR